MSDGWGREGGRAEGGWGMRGVGGAGYLQLAIGNWRLGQDSGTLDYPKYSGQDISFLSIPTREKRQFFGPFFWGCCLVDKLACFFAWAINASRIRVCVCIKCLSWIQVQIKIITRPNKRRLGWHVTTPECSTSSYISRHFYGCVCPTGAVLFPHILQAKNTCWAASRYLWNDQ